MANDDNSGSPNRPFFGNDSFFEEIGRLGRRHGLQSAQDRLERRQIRDNKHTINSLEENPDLMAAVPEVAESARAQNNRLIPRVRQRRESRYDRAVNETVGSIERAFSPSSVNGEMRDISNSEMIQTRGLGMMGMSQRDLEGRRSAIMNEIGGLEKSSVGMAQNGLYNRESRQNPAVLADLQGNYARRRDLVQEAAVVNSALKKQRSIGEDEESKEENLLRAGQRAKGLLGNVSLGQELRSGQGLGSQSMDQLKQREVELSKQLVEALDKLRNSAGESAENIDKMKEEAGKVSENLSKTQAAIGMGGGGGPFNRLSGRDYAGMGMQALNAVGQTAQEALINQPLNTLGSRAGFAAMANQQYRDRNSAIGGDMTSLLMTNPGLAKMMTQVGENFANNTNIVRSANAGVGAIQAGMGGYELGHGIAEQFNPGSHLVGSTTTDIGTGFRELTQGMSQVAISGADYANQTSRSATSLQGRSAVRALGQEAVQVSGDMMQSFYDYSMGTRNAALSAGGSGGRLMAERFAGDRGGRGGLLSTLQNARISPADFNRLSGGAAAEQGNVFDVSQIASARGMERSGFGSMESNMQRMTTLAGAGTNNPTSAMASVLEAAFGRSLDSSKALNLMVSHTAEMAKNSIGMQIGAIDVTKSGADRLASLVNPNNGNQAAAINRAATAEQTLNSMNSGITSSFSDQLGISRIARASGLGRTAAMAFKNINDDEAGAWKARLESYDKMTPNQKQTVAHDLQNAGLGAIVGPNGSVNAKQGITALNTRGQGALADLGILSNIDTHAKGYEAFMSGKLTAKDFASGQYSDLYTSIGQAARLTKGLSADELIAGVNASPPPNGSAKKQASNALSGNGGTAIQRTLDDTATAQNADQANKARIVAQQGGGADKAINEINKSIQSLVKGLNDKTAGSFQNAAGEAAKHFKDGADVFLTAVGRFNSGLGALNTIPMNTSAAVEAKVKELINKSNSVKTPGKSKR